VIKLKWCFNECYVLLQTYLIDQKPTAKHLSSITLEFADIQLREDEKSKDFRRMRAIDSGCGGTLVNQRVCKENIQENKTTAAVGQLKQGL
jgi:hypothetical protein